MKRFYQLYLLLVLAVATSCNFTEEIFIEADGSGSMALRFDGSEMMGFTDGAMDSIPEAATDSVIYFKDILEEKKDSIATLPPAEQTRLERLRPYRMRIQSDPQAETLFFTLERDFVQVSEIGDAFAAFQDASALEGQNRPPGNGRSDEFRPATEVTFGFRKGRFSRKSMIVDSARHQQQLDSLEGAGMFLSGSTYTLKVHFPRQIKSANVQDATLSMDRKTIIREVDFLEYIKNPRLLDLEVELER